MKRRALILGCSAALGGCAAASLDGAIPAAETAIARAAAGEGQAGEDLAASVYLALARRELAEAYARLAIGDEGAARGLARRARADADLAAALAAEIGARDAAKRTSDHADALGSELAKPPRVEAPEGAR